MKINWFVIIVIYTITLVIVITSTYFITKKDYKPSYIINNNTIDTIIVEKIRIKYVPIIKTIKDTTNRLIDTLSFVKLDTTLSNGSKLEVEYYFPPRNEFYIKLDLVEKVKTKLDTIVIEKQKIEIRREYKEYIIVFVTGFALALLI